MDEVIPLLHKLGKNCPEGSVFLSLIKKAVISTYIHTLQTYFAGGGILLSCNYFDLGAI